MSKSMVVRKHVAAETWQQHDQDRDAFEAVASAFSSLGRVCLALDSEFHIRHMAPGIDELLGAGAMQRYALQPAQELLGEELFGVAGSLRSALAVGERREGWRAWLRTEPEGARLVSVSAAPLRPIRRACDPQAVYLVVLRPAEEDEDVASIGVPTASTGIIARSRAMVEVLRYVERLQHSDVTVLVTGESGVGKGVIAQAIHANSLRRDGPFVSVNCAALPDALLESELFGHVRGAFTGAVRDRPGRFEAAAHGTIFLDEIGDTPLPLQAKLLRVLQHRTFERVGENDSIVADVRVIAATNRDLRHAVETGRFREDLYYRLRVFPIEIPPLRDRREDIEPLARYLLAQIGQRSGRSVQLSPDTLRVLLAYDWPGNVRELENALEYAVTVAPGGVVRRDDLPRDILAEPGDSHATGYRFVAGSLPSAAAESEHVSVRKDGPQPARQRRAAPTAEELIAALDSQRWRVTETSRLLGVSRTTLWRWMRELNLER